MDLQGSQRKGGRGGNFPRCSRPDPRSAVSRSFPFPSLSLSLGCSGGGGGGIP